jgi:hypothetical protein
MNKNFSLRWMIVGAMVFMQGLAAGEDKPASQPEAAPKPAMIVYDTYLGDGWENWSWAKTELSIELAGSARRPIKVEAAGWQALYLHHEAFSTTGFKQLGFLIQGSAPEGDVRVFALTDGKVNNEGRPVKLGNRGWTQVVIPLAEVAAEDKMIDGIWVQNSSAADLPKFYVTEIRFE